MKESVYKSPMKGITAVTVSLTLFITACGSESHVDPEDTAAAQSLLKLPNASARARAAGRWIVVLNPSTSARGVLRSPSIATQSIRTRHEYRHALRGFAAELNDAQLERLAAHPDVASIEADLPVHAVIEPGVERIGTVGNTTANVDGVDDRVDVDIAVLDTGIDLDHPDLNVVADVNFVTPGTVGDDDNGHGSHCAGIAAALDDGVGVVGVAPGARLWSVKVLDAEGNGSLSGILAGVDYVSANADQIEVANMSLGGVHFSTTAWRTAIANSVGAGVVYVAAAGNDALDVYGDPPVLGGSVFDAATWDFYPAALPEVMAVSAMVDTDGVGGGLGSSVWSGADDTFASFTNYSRAVDGASPVVSAGAAIDVAAPGGSIISTYRDGDYASSSGTSMAAPHVAGAVALYAAQFGRATNASEVSAIRQALIDTAEPQNEWNPEGASNDPDANPEGLCKVDAFAPGSCGDGTCDGGEDCETCEDDCGACDTCGDDVCDDAEDCDSCALDCGACASCGDGTCDEDEDCETCADDCGSCDSCGDNVCDPIENCGNCADDCGQCDETTTLLFDDFSSGLGNWLETGAGDWNTELLHSSNGYPGEASGSPAAHLDNCDSECVLATTSPFDLTGFQSANLSLLRFVDSAVDSGEYLRVQLWNGGDWITVYNWGGGDGDDDTWHAESLDLTDYLDVPNFRVRIVGKTNRTNEHLQVDDLRLVANAALPQECGNDSCETDESCDDCPADCGICTCGDGSCNPLDGESCETCPEDCGECATCGDNECNGAESCGSCQQDCGACCGNDSCDFGETCNSCAEDCGTCCGDGECNGDETCDTCSQDCGDCCGNDSCDFGETCESCVQDCDPCPSCGDGECNGGEGCDSCTQDCGPCGGSSVLFSDPFSSLSRWSESGDGDWDVEAMHSSSGYPEDASGAPTAHVDNCDEQCVLEMTASIDLSACTRATLSFARFLDSAVDTGEYLRIDLWDGSQWVTEMEWGGSNGDDDSWHLEHIDLLNYMTVTDWKVRLLAKANRTNERIQIDDLSVEGIGCAN